MGDIMRYIFVNARKLKQDGYCALCCEAITESYVREIGTRLIYCTADHYEGHCRVAMGLLLENHARRVS